MTRSGYRTTPFHPTPRQHFHPHIMTSTVMFPAHATDPIESMSSVSVLSRQATALEICDMVYGNKTPSWEAIEHYYEPSASELLIFSPAMPRLISRLLQCKLLLSSSISPGLNNHFSYDTLKIRKSVRYCDLERGPSGYIFADKPAIPSRYPKTNCHAPHAPPT